MAAAIEAQPLRGPESDAGPGSGPLPLGRGLKPSSSKTSGESVNVPETTNAAKTATPPLSSSPSTKKSSLSSSSSSSSSPHAAAAPETTTTSTTKASKRRGGRANGRRKDKPAEKATSHSSDAAPAASTVASSTDDDATADGTNGKSNFDCSSAIAQVCEGVWASAVSGTRMGASLEGALLEQGVTAVVSTVSDAKTSETFENHAVDTAESDASGVLRPLHAACDFIHEAVSEGGVVFIHSRSGFARSDWAVLVVLGYMVKYQSVKLHDAVERLAETTKHAISPAGKFRRELVQFEEDALGEASVSEEWAAAEDVGANGSKNHSLSRRKLAENLNDRRLLKKKSPHK